MVSIVSEDLLLSRSELQQCPDVPFSPVATPWDLVEGQAEFYASEVLLTGMYAGDW